MPRLRQRMPGRFSLPGLTGALLITALVASSPMAAWAQEEEKASRPDDVPEQEESSTRLVYPIPEDGDVVGEIKTVIADEEDTLIDIGRQHGLGYEEMRRANPDLSMWYPGEGAEVVLPQKFILPPGPRDGVVVNLSELRLYYYPDVAEGETPVVQTYPISVGREGFSTPLGETRTTMKVKDPSWSPPASMRREAAERGDPPPEIVPPGPDNPLGRHAILLDIPGYLLHGTNRPDGVGMRVSRGCIRLYPENIEYLYNNLPNNTTVRIINEPFKVGWDGDMLYVQAYPLLKDDGIAFEPIINAVDAVDAVMQESEKETPPVDYARVRYAMDSANGEPEPVLSSAPLLVDIAAVEALGLRTDFFRELDTEATWSDLHSLYDALELSRR
ncbi:L,D-transpeptidase family protein [Aidingimonas lacisalsi]|uniref:L,D-transpeptidase family protein n=1 Tax=Aidingimonas lacisalsi TaxID=2604086 RepID=UPI0011D1EFAB|nr:L,D-transpeptidase family protein [Aidingimonas lacisalsi]